jgi:pyruvate/2-oxoglutarate dehydrogenase complex dihydrolipoamide dehydrogenase (E3) component
VLEGERVFLNLGTHATIPPIPGLAEDAPLTHIEVLELDRVPEHLVVLGGGYVGLEFAQAYRRFGSRVTIVEREPQLLDREDPDVADEMRRILGGEGIEVLLAADVLGVEGRSGAGVRLRVRTSRGEQTVTGTDILAAVGRTPNTAGIGLEVAGVQLDSRGYIKVNDRLETSAPDVWAVGECAGSPQFTHVSFDDFRIIRDNLAGGNRSTRDRLVPYCLFTDPPLARVGLSEGGARQRGIAVRVAKVPMSAVLRTWTLGERTGFMKVLVEGTGDRILGFTMIGPEAGEVMAAVETAILGELPHTVLRDAILTHPTMAEGLSALFAAIPAAGGEAIGSERDAQPASGPVVGNVRRLALVGAIVGMVGLAFAYVGGWLTPRQLTPARFIDTFERINGLHPGFRRNHAKGVCVSGYFDSNGRAARLSKAVVFEAGRVPVVGRFALAGGMPDAADSPQTVRSMALRFSLRDGEEWRTGMNSIPVFAVNTPEGFRDQLVAMSADPTTGKPDPGKVQAFLAAHPESARALAAIKAQTIAAGFENSTYNSLDAFEFVDSVGNPTPVRWSMVPLQPFVAATTEPPHGDPNFLFDSLIAQVKAHPLQWRLVVTIGQPGDPTNDATIAWPDDREKVDAGTLTIDRIESEDTSPVRTINFDPLVLPDGITGSDDPLLSARSATYSVSFTRRLGEPASPSAVSPAAIHP